MSETKANNPDSTLVVTQDSNAVSGDALGLRDVLTGVEERDPCNITSNLHFRFDSVTGNTLVDVQPDDSRAAAQHIVLPGVDLTSGGSLSDSQVIQLLLAQGRLSTEL